MSAYNILNTEVECSNCKHIYKGIIQFKFGNTWQLKYSVGEIIKWGGNDIGESNLSVVKVYGILEEEECPNCLQVNLNNEFDISIKKDIIKGVKPLSDPKDYFANGSYKILKK